MNTMPGKSRCLSLSARGHGDGEGGCCEELWWTGEWLTISCNYHFLLIFLCLLLRVLITSHPRTVSAVSAHFYHQSFRALFRWGIEEINKRLRESDLLLPCKTLNCNEGSIYFRCESGTRHSRNAKRSLPTKLQLLKQSSCCGQRFEGLKKSNKWAAQELQNASKDEREQLQERYRELIKVISIVYQELDSLNLGNKSGPSKRTVRSKQGTRGRTSEFTRFCFVSSSFFFQKTFEARQQELLNHERTLHECMLKQVSLNAL